MTFSSPVQPWQTTICSPIFFSGVGLHSGCRVEMSIHPAPADTGVVFIRTDLNNFPMEAHVAYVANVNYATTLMKRGVTISTVEHVLAALFGMGVDNAYIHIDNLEIPILDGSAIPYVVALQQSGIIELDTPRVLLVIRKAVQHKLGDKLACARPSPDFSLKYTIDFPHPLIGHQTFDDSITPECFPSELAAFRTFGFLRDLKKLQEDGLIKGGGLENAVVLDTTGVINPEGLRAPDEFVRHKALDFIGDLALLGMPVLGSFEAERAGHGIHAALIRKILADASHYELIQATSEKPALLPRAYQRTLR